MFKKKRLSFKYVTGFLKEYNAQNGTDLAIEPNYEYYQLIDKADRNRQLKRGTLRECFDAIPAK